jgi:hypothetical protein
MDRFKKFVKENQDALLVMASGVCACATSIYCIKLMKENDSMVNTLRMVRESIERGETFRVVEDRLYVNPPT